MTINERIKKRRQELGLSVDDVADKLGLNRATIYRYEKEDISKLPASVLDPLAKVLRTTPYVLMGWDAPEPDTAPVVPALPPDVQELALQIQQLDAEDRAVIRGEVRAMLRADKYKKGQESVS